MTQKNAVKTFGKWLTLAEDGSFVLHDAILDAVAMTSIHGPGTRFLKSDFLAAIEKIGAERYAGAEGSDRIPSAARGGARKAGPIANAVCTPLISSFHSSKKNQDGVVHLKAEHVESLTVSAAQMTSHDFH